MVEHPDVDLVVVTAPNMLHVEMISAAAAAGKAVFCEKPVGGTPAQTVTVERAARHVVTGVGYNYRWAPLVQYAEQLVDSGRLGVSRTTADASSRATGTTRSACCRGVFWSTKPATV